MDDCLARDGPVPLNEARPIFMSRDDGPPLEGLLAAARRGRKDSLGALLELYRSHLQALAGVQLTRRLQTRVNPSDLVQETFLQASCHFDDFRGETEQELVGWLRTILRRCLLRMVQRQVLSRKRSLLREVALRYDDSEAERRPSVRAASLVSPGSSPSTPLRRRERTDLVIDRLSRLPAALREVLVLRNLQGLPFAEVARQMGRSPGAVRVLWLRALDKLRRQSSEGELP